MSGPGPAIVFPGAEDPSGPYAALARLRTEDPVHRAPFDTWIVTRHAYVDSLNGDPRLSRDLRTWRHYRLVRPYLAGSTLERYLERWLLSLDPPDHTRLRKLASSAFSPRRIEAMRSSIEHIVDGLLRGLPTEGELDFLTAFAQPLPLRVISGLLSLPGEDLARLHAWAESVAIALEPLTAPEQRMRADRAVSEMGSYLTARIAERRGDPGGDLLGQLVQAEEAGNRMSEDELVAMLLLLFVAGHETTTNLLGNGMLALLRHPDQAERLVAEPSVIRSAVEEMLRYEPSTMLNIRLARQPVEVGGTLIGSGHAIYCMLGAANRDPDVFPDPDRFDITRSPNPHVSFGGGAHYCLGAPLARLQAQVAFPMVLRRWSRIDLVTDEVRWRPTVNVRGLLSLPIRVRS